MVKIREKLAEDHPSRLASQYTLACAYLGNRQVGKAIELLEHVVKIQEQNEHDRLASQRMLAYAYRENGQTDKAMEIEGTLISDQSG